MKKNKEVQILKKLKTKFPTYINTDLLRLSISQDKHQVYLNKIFQTNPEKIESETLDFIADDDLIPLEPMISSDLFNPLLTVEENAVRFIDKLDAYSIMMCFDNIFTKEVEEEILKKRK